MIDTLHPSKRYQCLRYLTLKAAHDAGVGASVNTPAPGVRAIEVLVPTPGGSPLDAASPLLSFQFVLVVFGGSAITLRSNSLPYS